MPVERPRFRDDLPSRSGIQNAGGVVLHERHEQHADPCCSTGMLPLTTSRNEQGERPLGTAANPEELFPFNELGSARRLG